MAQPVLAETVDPIREARVDLAAAYRIAGRLSFDDTIWNHFSLRVPGRDDLFLIKAHGLLFEEVTASNLLIVDRDGDVVEGAGKVERSAVCIHSRIHEMIPRAACVLHSHMRHAAWLSMLEGGRLLPVHQNSLRFYGRVSYDDHFSGMATNLDEGRRIAGVLADNDLAILANHGAISIGRSVAEALYNLYYLEVSCEEQYMLACSGKKPRLIEPAVAESVLKDYECEADAPFEYLAAMKRLLLRTEPGFKS
jgi:ribulose-5-phosphate 4-epimerase/fuculose-1-phosphate aldolase